MILVGGYGGSNGSTGSTYLYDVEKYDVDGFVTQLPNMTYKRYMY